MREAVWLTTESAETTIDRHEGYVLCPEFFRRAKGQTALVVLGALFFAGAVAAAVASSELLPLALVSVAALSLGAIPLAAFWERRQAARREPDLALKEGFGKGPGQFVQMIVRQGDAPTGIDRGMLWIEDGRLYFSGHRTSFGLVAGQTRSISSKESPLPGLRHEIVLGLRHDAPGGPMSISFGVVVPPNVSGWSERHDLVVRLDRWRRLDRPGDGQWPPADLGPGVASERRLLRDALLASLPLPLGLALWAIGAANPLLMVGALAASFAFLRNGNVATRWRAVRDRRRLRRRL